MSSIYLLIMLDTQLLRFSLHFTQLHFTPLHYTFQHFTSSHLNFNQLHFTTLSFGLTPLKFHTALLTLLPTNIPELVTGLLQQQHQLLHTYWQRQIASSTMYLSLYLYSDTLANEDNSFQNHIR